MNTYFKVEKVRSKKLTDAARGQSCKLRTPVCNNDNSTVVFCHAPSPLKGTGTKSDDFWGADGCSRCHRYVDEVLAPLEAMKYWITAIYWTQKDRFERELITTK